MELHWLIIAMLGVLAGLAISKAALNVAHPISRQTAAVMVSVWSGLLAVFLLAPLIRIPLGVVLHGSGSWRLFGAYGYTAILAISRFGACLVYTLVRNIKLLLMGAPRSGA
jgi:hypothetical protein